jgi:hypothetical protein
MTVTQQILKVQRSGCGNSVLLYTKDDTILRQEPWRDVKDFLGIHGTKRMTKRYVYADVTKKRIHITGQAPSQDW